MLTKHRYFINPPPPLATPSRKNIYTGYNQEHACRCDLIIIEHKRHNTGHNQNT
jgi:hypothetical protein